MSRRVPKRRGPLPGDWEIKCLIWDEWAKGESYAGIARYFDAHQGEKGFPDETPDRETIRRICRELSMLPQHLLELLPQHVRRYAKSLKKAPVARDVPGEEVGDSGVGKKVGEAMPTVRDDQVPTFEERLNGLGEDYLLWSLTGRQEAEPTHGSLAEGVRKLMQEEMEGTRKLLVENIMERRRLRNEQKRGNWKGPNPTGDRPHP